MTLLGRALQGTAAVTGLAVGSLLWYTSDVASQKIPVTSNLRYIEEQQGLWYSDCYAVSISPPTAARQQGGSVRLTDAFARAFFWCAPGVLAW